MDQDQQLSNKSINIFDIQVRRKMTDDQLSKIEFSNHQELDHIAINKEHPRSDP